MVISELQRFFRFRQANHLNGTGKKRSPRSTNFLSYYPYHKWNEYLADEPEKTYYFQSMIDCHGTMFKVDDSVEYQTLESRFWYCYLKKIKNQSIISSCLNIGFD